MYNEASLSLEFLKIEEEYLFARHYKFFVS